MTEEEIQEEKNENLNIKHWIMKIVQVFVLFAIIIYAIERYFHIPILIDTMIAILITLSIGFTHEGLHYYQAVKLGYKPKWYRTRFMMGFEIEHKRRSSTWSEHKKKIAILPYKVLIPISIIILVVGFLFSSIGLIAAGVASLLMHAVSWFHEGKDVN